ncbi:MAG: FeoB-associated Cys-rich membrane protein [Phocaeicola sp.]
MDLQQIIVFAILALCIGWLGVRIYRSINQVKEGNSPCEGCNSECSLKNRTTPKGGKKDKNAPCK